MPFHPHHLLTATAARPAVRLREERITYAELERGPATNSRTDWSFSR